jgi:hypothetical protein
MVLVRILMSKSGFDVYHLVLVASYYYHSLVRLVVVVVVVELVLE